MWVRNPPGRSGQKSLKRLCRPERHPSTRLHARDPRGPSPALRVHALRGRGEALPGAGCRRSRGGRRISNQSPGENPTARLQTSHARDHTVGEQSVRGQLLVAPHRCYHGRASSSTGDVHQDPQGCAPRPPATPDAGAAPKPLCTTVFLRTHIELNWQVRHSEKLVTTTDNKIEQW